MVTVNTDAPTLNITFREVLSRDTIRENNEREDNPDPKEKALLDQFPGGKGIKDVIELIKKDRMDAMAEAKHAQREDGPSDSPDPHKAPKKSSLQ